ncbi:MAG: hypothetical protein CSA75_02535 [Sorangium cellulosum]|nr:MAG: hypothetical protein CSA75_02535 [Sorangium cellulosum]
MPTPNSGTSKWLGADIVIGSRGRKTAVRGLLDLIEAHVLSFGWTVAHDDPYPGGATTDRMGDPDQGIQAVQLELARRLYMDERTLMKAPRGFDYTKSFCHGLVAKLGVAALG